MSCISFFVFIASGVFIVPLLQFLKTLPKVGAFIAQWAVFIAPLLSALAPVIAQAATPYCAVVDPLLWTFLYAGAVYLVSQLTYWLSKRAVPAVGTAMKL